MANKTLLRLGCGQKKILEGLLFDEITRLEGPAKHNRIIRREYQIIRKLYTTMTQRGRLCPTCGQRINT